jgi:hypothetical protein
MLGLGTAVNRGGFVSADDPLLLDTYSGAAAAYSLRKLSNSYSGNCVTVRRDSDNLDANIGFSGGVLDTSALASHCGSANGFVVTWFDQSGNSNNATQTTSDYQPKIYDGTTGVITENSKPALQFDGSDDGLELQTSITDTRKYTLTVHAVDASDTQWSIFESDPINYTGPLAQSSSSSAIVYGYTLNNLFTDGGSAFSGTRNDLYNVYNDGNNHLTTFDFSGEKIKHLFKRTSFLMQGKSQEVIIYPSDQSSNRTNIESNINTFYSIF